MAVKTVCVCVCLCVYMCVCVHNGVPVCVYMCVCVHNGVPVCIYMCVCVSITVCLCVYMCVCVHNGTCERACMRVITWTVYDIAQCCAWNDDDGKIIASMCGCLSVMLVLHRLQWWAAFNRCSVCTGLHHSDTTGHRTLCHQEGSSRFSSITH